MITLADILYIVRIILKTAKSSFFERFFTKSLSQIRKGFLFVLCDREVTVRQLVGASLFTAEGCGRSCCASQHQSTNDQNDIGGITGLHAANGINNVDCSQCGLFSTVGTVHAHKANSAAVIGAAHIGGCITNGSLGRCACRFVKIQIEHVPDLFELDVVGGDGPVALLLIVGQGR